MVSKLAWSQVLKLVLTPVVGAKTNILILFYKNARFFGDELFAFSFAKPGNSGRKLHQ